MSPILEVIQCGEGVCCSMGKEPAQSISLSWTCQSKPFLDGIKTYKRESWQLHCFNPDIFSPLKMTSGSSNLPSMVTVAVT